MGENSLTVQLEQRAEALSEKFIILKSLLDIFRQYSYEISVADSKRLKGFFSDPKISDFVKSYKILSLVRIKDKEKKEAMISEIRISIQNDMEKTAAEYANVETIVSLAKSVEEKIGVSRETLPLIKGIVEMVQSEIPGILKLFSGVAIEVIKDMEDHRNDFSEIWAKGLFRDTQNLIKAGFEPDFAHTIILTKVSGGKYAKPIIENASKALGEARKKSR